ncbi:HU family DNA-binding protein [Candidatus Tachikawaea gelatinosa]|uniref:DNA-binding protein HU-beta n=1 Tax=Candidatus Tachikawaea gelatinosa TaxID=1410383 RepID=A0A090ASH9_9ENTR|nr:HU family DNA-binding protein [Candidatus Tachikawaea gelatinosa]BAP58830.1 DNA-binding protein HU-beta HupB [Candidatus Tachikawaea gelatinosa]
MNKSQLIEKIAIDADISKVTAGRVLNAFMGSVSNALRAGEEVTLIGFGTFSVRKRAARIGRNPQTGKEITIPAAKFPGFRPGKILKKVINE